MISRLCLLLALLVPLTAQAHVNLAAAPIGRMDLPWWRQRFEHTKQEARAHPGARLVWLYGRYDALNFGLIGDTTASVIWRIDHGEFAGLHPRLVVLLIGANNLGRTHWGAGQTVPGIEAVVDDLHRHVPRAHVLLLGILPSIRSAWISAQTRTINAALARHYAESSLVTFRDVGHVLETDGRPDPALYVDPRMHPPEPALHPDAEGMRRIAAALQPTIERLMR
ncbi:MAG: hypothetical protein B7Z59_06360 [Acidiphilium sp. 37-67-22]|nr:MAG: hypothetical protein B7Z59_06360 [Acidiphilium sp. 37-67-22]